MNFWVKKMTDNRLEKSALTALACKKLEYHGDSAEDKKKNILSDIHPHEGLKIKANKNGTKSWIYRFRTPSPERKVGEMRIGFFPEISLSEARAELQNLKKIRDEHGNPSEYIKMQKKIKREKLKQQVQAGHTLSDVIQYYLDRKVGVSDIKEKSKLEVEKLLRHKSLKTLADVPVSEIRKVDVSDVIFELKKTSPSVSERIQSRLREAFEFCIDQGFLDDGFIPPVPSVRGNTPKNKKTRFLNDDEIKKLIYWLPESRLSDNSRLVTCLTLLTGCRSGEIVSMDWRDVDLDAGVWVLKDTKNKNTHKVFLSSSVQKILKEMPRDKRNHWAFPSPKKGHIRQKAAGDSIGKYREDLGLSEPWGLHDLRRTFATGITELGCPRIVVKRLLNHTSGNVTDIYIQNPYDDEAKDWWNRWSDHVLSLGGDRVFNSLLHH